MAKIEKYLTRLKTLSSNHSPNNPIYMFRKKHFNRMRSTIARSMRGTLTAFITLIWATLAFAQPANDNCAGAITLTPIPEGNTCSSTIYTNVAATNAAAGNALNPECFNGQLAFKDVWFKFRTANEANANYRITIRGVSAADAIKNPQLALYIGSCGTLVREFCATKTAVGDTNAISFDAGCVRANSDYFIQVSSFLSTDLGGRFTVCVEKIDGIYTMRRNSQTTTACVGTLYDSGGPLSNYGNNENRWEFNIQPQATGCIEITVDSFNIETGANTFQDTLTIYDARTNQLLDRITGSTGQRVVFQTRTDRIRVLFSSNSSITASGFKLTWRSLINCSLPPPTSCNSPELITNLPFSRTGVTTCNDDLNAITKSPCNNNTFLQGRDHVYRFTSAGGRCIRALLTGLPTTTTNQTGFNIGLYYGCPEVGGSTCVATGRMNSTRDTVSIANATLEIAGDYYIVVSSREACGNYNISIDTTVCLNRLPNAGSCQKALSLNDCSNGQLSDIVLDLSAGGDSTFMNFNSIPRSINTGCIQTPGGVPRRYNYSFMYFKANANGKFGFTMSPLTPSNDPLNSSDIDFNVYGPIDRIEDICTYTRTNAPVRSSWAQRNLHFRFPNEVTGMVDTFFSPFFNRLYTVRDTADCSALDLNDGFVRTLNVQKDKFYVLWVNDYGGDIGRNGVRLNFSGTTNGVFNTTETFTAGRDTAFCVGGSAPLIATGGIGYKWTPSAGLNNDSIPNPIATPTRSTDYNVVIQGTCRIVPKVVSVRVFNVNDLQNQTVCRGEQITLNAGEAYPAALNATWRWTSSTNNLAELSCTTCPNPTLTATNTSMGNQVHTFTVTLTTPSCTLTKTVNITVTASTVASYRVITDPKPSRDTNICIGTNISLLQPGFDDMAVYTWSSVPASTITGQNPTVSPQVSTKYYLTVTGGRGNCNAPSLDSVIVNVFQSPVLNLASKTLSSCRDEVFKLGNTPVQPNTIYSWRNITANNTLGFTNPNDPNTTVAMPPTYGNVHLLVLTATNIGGCTKRDTVIVNGVDLLMMIDTPQVDSIRICRGTQLKISANAVFQSSKLPVKWDSNRDFNGIPIDSMRAITVSPIRRTKYYATIQIGVCRRTDSIEVYVDSLPTPRDILPKDTTVCRGELVILRSPVFDPVFFPGLKFKWENPKGALTPDSLYNLVVVGDTTHVYKRTATNGVCVQIDSVKLNVNKVPTIRITPADTSFCDRPGGVMVTLTASTPDAGVSDWKWKGPQGDISSGDGRQVITVTAAQQTNNYTVTAKIGNCPGTASAVIRIKPLPLVSFPNPAVVCLGSSITLNTNPNPNNTYVWSGTGITNPAAAAPNVTPTADTRYTVNTTFDGCTNTQEVTVRVATGSVAITGPTSTCVGSPVTWTANGTNTIDAGRFSWSPTGGTSNTNTINPNAAGTTTYTVTYTFGPNCTRTASATLRVEPSFSLRISPDTFGTRLIDQGTPLTLNALTSGNIQSPTYTWQVNGSPTTTGVTGGTINIRPMEDAAVKVTVSSSTGCTRDTQVSLRVRYANFDIPNAFTPNGDTINSFFGIIFNGLTPSPTNEPRPRFWKGRIEVQSLQVYNRIGQLVFDEKSPATLNSASYKGWDGRKGTTELPSDVYVYVIKLKMPDDKIEVKTGELNLIR
jgi:CHU_C Type IX secretion signal domain/CUB domain